MKRSTLVTPRSLTFLTIMTVLTLNKVDIQIHVQIVRRNFNVRQKSEHWVYCGLCLHNYASHFLPRLDWIRLLQSKHIIREIPNKGIYFLPSFQESLRKKFTFHIQIIR